MPVERTYIDALKDVLTFPGRLDIAFWEGLDAVFGDGSAKTVWNVLWNPLAARPEDLQTFSERFLHLDSGWTKFFVDTLINPVTVMGIGFAKGGGALRLHNGGPTPTGLEHMKQYAPLYDKVQVQPYAKILRKMGFEKSSGAEILMHERAGRFMGEYIPQYNAIANEFGEQWGPAKARIALYLDGRSVPGMTSQEVVAAERIRNEILDPVWDRIGTIERLTQKGDEFVADVEPIGYLTSYFTHMQNRQGWLSNDPKTFYNAIVHNPKYTQLLQAGKIKPLPFTPDTSISLSAHRDALLDWMQQDGAAQIFNPYLLKRGADVIPDELMGQLYILDLDRVMHGYLTKASRTYALQTPIDAGAARVLHGRIIENPVDVDEIGRLHTRIRQAWRAGDMQTVDESRAAVQALYQRMRETPEQHSLAYQVTMEAMEKIEGYDPTKTGAGTFFHKAGGSNPAQKIRARMFHDWYSLLIGKQDLERFHLSRAYASAMTRLAPHVTPELVGELDAMGAKLGMGDFGQKVINHVTKHSDTFEAAGLERALVGFTTANLLGLRPSSILMQMTQTPMMTMPTIGIGNTLAGVAEGVPKLARAYREALRHVVEQRRIGRPVAWREGLRVGFNKHLPDFAATGIPTDLTALEGAFNDATITGRFNLDKFINFVMGGFAAGEHANRVIAFYGAKRAARSSLRVNPYAFGYNAADIATDALEQDINRHAASIVYDTQFVPTAGRLTPLQKRLSPIGRQFLTYPISFTNGLLDMAVKGAWDQRTTQVGAALGRVFGEGRNYTGYARYLALMNGLTHFGRDVMGMELGERIQEGVVNLPLSPDQPFAPLPIPPIPGAIIAYVNSGLTGKLDRGATTDIPGYGTVPIPKAFVPAGMLVSQIARMMNQVKDGIMTDRDGRGLYEFDRHAAVANMLGLTTTSSARDNEKAKRLLYTGAKLREYRRRLGTAVAHGDMAMAESVRSEYAAQPEFRDAPPLSVKPGDVLRIKEAERTTRLQRIAKSVGSEIRGIVDPMYDPAGWYEPYHMESATTRQFN